jgi:hypothetical protein
VTNHGIPGVDFIDQPTFLQIPADFLTGRLRVNIASGVRPDAPELARGFAGIAYHVGAGEKPDFEAVYLRPANGWSVAPLDGPRRHRAVQYFADPDWPFSRLREEPPKGPYEAGADIRPGSWIQLTVTVRADSLSVDIDERTVLDVAPPLAAPAAGSIGLFVDIGTDAYFSDLTIDHDDR